MTHTTDISDMAIEYLRKAGVPRQHQAIARAIGVPPREVHRALLRAMDRGVPLWLRTEDGRLRWSTMAFDETDDELELETEEDDELDGLDVDDEELLETLLVEDELIEEVELLLLLLRVEVDELLRLDVLLDEDAEDDDELERLDVLDEERDELLLSSDSV